MGSGAPTPPTPPDANATATAQQGYNEAAQRASMVGQDTPFGSLSFEQTGTGPNGVPVYTAKTNYSPDQQNLLTALMGTKNVAAAQGQKLLTDADYGSKNPGDVVGDMSSGLTKDMLNTETAYLNPQFDRDVSNLDAKLRNQGFNPGEKGYVAAMDALKDSQGRQVNSFLATAEPQAYAQATSRYLMPLTTGENLSTYGSPVAPTFQSSAGWGMQPANFTQAQQLETQAQEQNYQSQMAANSNMMSGLFGIPTAVLGGWAKGGFPGLAAAA